MAGGSNSKKPINRGSDSTIKEDIIEGNNVQEHATGLDQHFYDGIPCFGDGKSTPTLAKLPKVSEVSLCLGKANNTIGFGKVLDTIVSAAPYKWDKISILAFEVANTIVKGFYLLQSLSTDSIRHLKEEVLLSEVVQDLVSEDMDELLRIVAADKRLELKVFSDAVVRFGNHSKNPHWHNLDHYFEDIQRQLSRDAQSVEQISVTWGQTRRQLSRDEGESKVQQLMTVAQFTYELYHELLALDNFEQDWRRKCEAKGQSGDSLALLRSKIRSQRKQIRHLKKKSLWSRSLDEVVEKLVDVVNFLHLEISNAFGTADGNKPLIGHISNRQRLGPTGLALHYANIVLQIDTLFAARSTMPANTKDALYQNLPPNIKLALRSKVPSLHVVEDLTVAIIKCWMEKLLHRLVPMATNTSKAHHTFGWIGEWANTGSEVNRKSGVMWIETFHHADKDKVEDYILELLLWLHRLVIRSKVDSDAGKLRSATNPLLGLPSKTK